MRINPVKQFLLKALQTQLLLSIMSLPILVHWGLPISLMTIVGNLIFTPILTFMLILSSLIFFTELFYIPNNYLTNILNMLVYAWNNSLHLGNFDWMVGFAHPGILTLACIPIITMLSLKSSWVKTLQQRVIIMSLLFALSCGGLWIYGKLKNPITLEQKRFTVELNENKTLSFIDNGYFNTKATPDKALEFELKPYLTKKFGTPAIQNLTLNRPSKRSFLGALALCESYRIKEITVPYWRDIEDKKKAWAYGKLKRKAYNQGILWKRKVK